MSDRKRAITPATSSASLRTSLVGAPPPPPAPPLNSREEGGRSPTTSGGGGGGGAGGGDDHPLSEHRPSSLSFQPSPQQLHFQTSPSHSESFDRSASTYSGTESPQSSGYFYFEGSGSATAFPANSPFYVVDGVNGNNDVEQDPASAPPQRQLRTTDIERATAGSEQPRCDAGHPLEEQLPSPPPGLNDATQHPQQEPHSDDDDDDPWGADRIQLSEFQPTHRRVFRNRRGGEDGDEEGEGGGELVEEFLLRETTMDDVFNEMTPFVECYDVVHHVYSFLSVSEANALRGVNRLWYAAAMSLVHGRRGEMKEFVVVFNERVSHDKQRHGGQKEKLGLAWGIGCTAPTAVVPWTRWVFIWEYPWNVSEVTFDWILSVALGTTVTMLLIGVVVLMAKRPNFSWIHYLAAGVTYCACAFCFGCYLLCNRFSNDVPLFVALLAWYPASLTLLYTPPLFLSLAFAIGSWMISGYQIAEEQIRDPFGLHDHATAVEDGRYNDAYASLPHSVNPSPGPGPGATTAAVEMRATTADSDPFGRQRYAPPSCCTIVLACFGYRQRRLTVEEVDAMMIEEEEEKRRLEREAEEAEEEDDGN